MKLQLSTYKWWIGSGIELFISFEGKLPHDVLLFTELNEFIKLYFLNLLSSQVKMS